MESGTTERCVVGRVGFKAGKEGIVGTFAAYGLLRRGAVLLRLVAPGPGAGPSELRLSHHHLTPMWFPHSLPQPQMYFSCFASSGARDGCPRAADSSADGLWAAGARGVAVQEKAAVHFAGFWQVFGLLS